MKAHELEKMFEPLLLLHLHEHRSDFLKFARKLITNERRGSNLWPHSKLTISTLQFRAHPCVVRAGSSRHALSSRSVVTLSP